MVEEAGGHRPSLEEGPSATCVDLGVPCCTEVGHTGPPAVGDRVAVVAYAAAMRDRTAGRVVALTLAAVLVVAACGSDDGGSDEDGAASAPTTTSAVSGLPGAEGIGPNDDGVDPLPPLPEDLALPIVFVHGFAGSAQQFESQAMRFVANGYPQERIVAYDHDGAGSDIEGYADGADEVVDAALEEFDVEQVYLVGHSRGTSVGTAYLEDPTRAAKVAKYVSLDGRPCPDAVPCLAPTQETNPGQSHVEVATSKESFAALYEFLVGTPAEVVEIVPQRDPVVLSGRAVNFPANTGRTDTTLDVWEVDADTGARLADEPHATFELASDGGFGPLVIRSGAHYEYELSTPESPIRHHLYPQPTVRSSSLMRLLSSDPGGSTRTNTNAGEDHASLIAIRMREWYAADDPDRPGDESDVLEIATTSATGGEEAVNAIVGHVGNGAIGLHIHDDAATPGVTTLAALPYFSTQPFQSGIDVVMPGADEPDGTISVTNLPRGDADRPQTLNVPNWASSRHSITVMFADYPVD